MSDGMMIIIVLLTIICLPIIIYLPFGGITFISKKIKAYRLKKAGAVTLSDGSVIVPQKPEKVEPYPDRAKFSVRFWAFFMDCFVLNIPLRLFHLLVFTFTQAYQPVNRLIKVSDFFLPIIVYLWYFSYYCYKHNGQTLGKKWNKIRVASMDGSYPSLKRLTARALIQFWLPLVIVGQYAGLWYITYLPALTKEKRALHDYIVKTKVIRVE